MSLIKYFLSAKCRDEISNKITYDYAIINEQYDEIYCLTENNKTEA